MTTERSTDSTNADARDGSRDTAVPPLVLITSDDESGVGACTDDSCATGVK